MAAPLSKLDQREFADGHTRFETATETMADYIGYLRRTIWEEQDKPSPNEQKIKALEEQCATVVDEQQAITTDKEALIRKALYVYAPFLKALRS